MIEMKSNKKAKTYPNHGEFFCRPTQHMVHRGPVLKQWSTKIEVDGSSHSYIWDGDLIGVGSISSVWGAHIRFLLFLSNGHQSSHFLSHENEENHKLLLPWDMCHRWNFEQFLTIGSWWTTYQFMVDNLSKSLRICLATIYIYICLYSVGLQFCRPKNIFD